MNTKLLLFFFCFLAYSNSNAQIFGNKTLVTTANDNLDNFIFNDIDTDGDIDIIASSKTTDQVFWYKNLGSETFTSKIVLSTSYVNPSNVKLLDVDVDGKKDVLVGETGVGAGVSWIRNMGSGFFGNKQSISSCGFCALTSIDVGDIDNDGDEDIIVSELSNDTLRLTKNIGGGVFEVQSSLIYLTTEGRNLYSFEFANLDGDNQNELILSTGGTTTQKIIQIEYNGTAFVQTLLYSSSVANPFIFESYLSDMDNDGQKDIITKIQDCGVVWFKNFGANVFSSPNSIGLPCSSGALSTIGDIDLDGNSDLVLSSLKWRENLGGGSFNSTLIPVSTNNDNALSSKLFDIDNDGDLDLFYYNATQFAWHRNNSAQLSNEEFNVNILRAYPNPIKDLLNISYDKEISSLSIYDLLGQEVLSIAINDNESAVNISNLASGTYLVKVTSNNEVKTFKVIKE